MAFQSESLALVPLPGAVRVGRQYTRATLRGWGYRDERFESDVELVVSELLTNSIQALGVTPEPHHTTTLLSKQSLIRITLIKTDETLRIEVWDPAPRMPRIRDRVSADSITGRGLEIVDAIAESVGWRAPYDDLPLEGKVVFAILALPERHCENGPQGDRFTRVP
ncbi:ATP-binding protein [Spongiactinospora sp. 9N601]|uniref:ATP-binding protein n=1 Tax=Spongiactinospora sp. 9N601 TaxID=3375149 RepID=UPI0037938906